MIFIGTSEAPSEEKKGRTRAQNIALNNFIDGGGGRPKIEIPIGKKRPLGKWSAQWVSEMGIIVRQNIPLTFHYWKNLEEEHKIPLYEKVQVMFVIVLRSVLVSIIFHLISLKLVFQYVCS